MLKWLVHSIQVSAVLFHKVSKNKLALQLFKRTRIKVYTTSVTCWKKAVLGMDRLRGTPSSVKNRTKTAYFLLWYTGFSLVTTWCWICLYPALLFSSLIWSSSWWNQEGICQVYHNGISESFKLADTSDLCLLNSCCGKLSTGCLNSKILSWTYPRSTRTWVGGRNLVSAVVMILCARI